MSLDLDDRDAEPKPVKQRPLSESELTGLLQDWQWTEKALAAGKLDGYAGLSIAVLDGTVVESSPDAVALRENVALAREVDPEQLVVFYVNPIDVWPPINGNPRV